MVSVDLLQFLCYIYKECKKCTEMNVPCHADLMYVGKTQYKAFHLTKLINSATGTRATAGHYGALSIIALL